MLDKHEFVRGHGLGNDYLVVDGERFGVALTPARIVAICDRHTGVGSDGILERVAAPAGFDAAVRIYNPDGSEAEKSGNGMRIFAKFCFDHGYATAERPLRMHTLGGPVEAELVARESDRTVLRMSMGHVSFRCADLPMDGRGSDEWVGRKLVVGDREFTATCLSVGNPHAVLFDAPFDEATVRRYGPLVENHAQFPAPHQRAVHPAGRPVDGARAHLGARRRLDAVLGHLELRGGGGVRARGADRSSGRRW